MQLSEFQKKVYSATKRIPKGKVGTYVQLACIVGEPYAARAVASALSKNFLEDIPCHRVVRSDEKIGGYNRGMAKKIELLTKEGIEISKNRINLDQFQWKKNLFLK